MVRGASTRQLGAAGNAHALAQAGDGDLLCHVHDAAPRRVGGLAQGCAHGVSVHGGHGQPQAERRRQRGRRQARAQHDGVKAANLGLPLQGKRQRGGADPLHAGVEGKFHGGPLQALAQLLGQQAAVARGGAGQVDGGGQRRFGREAGFGAACGVGIHLLPGHAGFAQDVQRWLELCALQLGAQQQQAALAAFDVQFVLAGKGLQARQAVLGQAFQCGGRGAARARGLAPAAQPDQVGAAPAAGQAQCGVGTHEPQRRAEARQGPGVGQVRCQQARRGKAGLLGGSAVLFKNGDFVAVADQLVRSGDAGDAGAHDGDLHGWE